VRNKSTGVLAIACLALFLSACSTFKEFSGVPVGEQATLITSVPPLLQTRQISCGPTCVAAVAAYWDQDFAPLVSTNKPSFVAEDCTAADLKALAERLSLRAFVYRGSVEDLETNLRKGRPVILLIPKPKYRDGFGFAMNGVVIDEAMKPWLPAKSHWIVGIGFTDKKIIVHDPAFGRIALSRWKLEEWWKARRFTCVLVAPN
jgi:predicted double-glycine peptidase